jgi:hypothetical protein
LRELGEFDDARGGRAGEADFGERAFVHAGEDGDAEKARALFGVAGGFASGAHHGEAAGGVKREQADARHAGGGGDAVSDCVWDVVKLEVEENAEAERGEFRDDARAFGGKELVPDLTEPDRTLQTANECGGGPNTVHIQGDD